jgi:HK97 family phage portal protein
VAAAGGVAVAKVLKPIFGRARAADTRIETHAAPVPLTVLPNRTPVYPSGAFIPLANHTYRKNELIFRGVNLIIGGVLEAPLKVFDSAGNDLRDHPLEALLRRPNPVMSAAQLWRKTILHLYLAGDAYWLKVRNRIGGIAELWPLRPDRVSVIADEFGLIAGYHYNIKGDRSRLALDEVVRFHFEDPIDDYAGFAPLMAALVRVAIDNEASDMMKSLLQNYAIPPIAVMTQSALDESVVERLRQKWRKAFGGKNRGEPAFLQQGMDIKTLGLSMRELAFPELDASSQKRVLVAIGVPPVLLGQEATFANYEQARQSFYEDTVEPLQAELADAVEHSLLHADFDRTGRLGVWFDTSEVSALRPARQARATIAREAFQAGASTQNEYRAQIGLPPAEDGDIYLRLIAVMPVARRRVTGTAEDGRR